MISDCYSRKECAALAVVKNQPVYECLGDQVRGGRIMPEPQTDWTLDIYTIEQMCNRLPHDCWADVATGVSLRGKHLDGSVSYVHAYCKKLTCRTCAGKLCSTLKDSLLAAIAEHQLLYFVTLTLPGDVKPGQQERKLKKSFSKLKRAANRAFGDISYVWVVSCHRNGSLHLHTLTNTDLRRGSENGKQIEWLKQKWHRLTGAHQARCASFPIRDANNLAAYMVKNLITGVLTRPEIIRRRGCSRCVNWRAQIEREEDGTEWSFVRKPTALIAVEEGITDTLTLYNGSFTIPPKYKTVGAKRQPPNDNHNAAVRLAPQVPNEHAAPCCCVRHSQPGGIL